MTRIEGDWLSLAATQAIFDVYERAGFQLFVVGGCVRNALLGVPVTDIDMTSDARPDVAVEFLQDAGFKVIPTGLDHGTITVVSAGVAHEITTFRSDVETDGRHAVVKFSKTIEEDAQRRDFTINALYADRNGAVFDYVNGLADIDGPHIRFIGDAVKRIREDYLRSLRFFRFHAWYGRDQDGFDPEALAAISGNLDGLANLSRERVGSEVVKLLTADNPVPAIMVMAQTGVLGHILPGADPRGLGPFVHLEADVGLRQDAVVRLASFADEAHVKSLRLSKAQMKALGFIREAAIGSMAPQELGYRLGVEQGLAALVLRSAVFEQPLAETAKTEIQQGAQAEFPIKAADLQPKFEGAALGQKLRELEADWIASGFSKSKAQLLG